VQSPCGRVRSLPPVLWALGIGWHTLGMHGPDVALGSFTGQAEGSTEGASVAGVVEVSLVMRRHAESRS
jgi:hypothetical protein